MTTKIYKTKKAFERAVKRAIAEGHVFKGYSWNAAHFEDLIIIRNF